VIAQVGVQAKFKLSVRIGPLNFHLFLQTCPRVPMLQFHCDGFIALWL
jgi:hypothetical protein